MQGDNALRLFMQPTRGSDTLDFPWFCPSHAPPLDSTVFTAVVQGQLQRLWACTRPPKSQAILV